MAEGTRSCDNHHKSCPRYYSMFEYLSRGNIFISERMCAYYRGGICECPESVVPRKKKKDD